MCIKFDKKMSIRFKTLPTVKAVSSSNTISGEEGTIKPLFEGSTFKQTDEQVDLEDEKPKVTAKNGKRKRVDGAGGVNAEQPTFEFEGFVPESIINYASILIYGARRIGKTHLASWILSKISKRFKDAYLFSETIHVQPDAWAFIPKEHRYSNFDELKLLSIFQEQEAKIGEIQRRWKLNGEKGDIQALINKDVPHILLVLDDIVANPRVQKSGILNKVFILGRHLRITIILLSQNACASGSVSLQARGNVDYCFTSQMNSLDDWERIASYYFGLEGKRKGIEALKHITDTDHTFAVAELHKQGRKKLGDYCCKIKAPAKIPKFKIAENNVWKDPKCCTSSATRATKLSKLSIGTRDTGVSKMEAENMSREMRQAVAIREGDLRVLYAVNSHMF